MRQCVFETMIIEANVMCNNILLTDVGFNIGPKLIEARRKSRHRRIDAMNFDEITPIVITRRSNELINLLGNNIVFYPNKANLANAIRIIVGRFKIYSRERVHKIRIRRFGTQLLLKPSLFYFERHYQIK